MKKFFGVIYLKNGDACVSRPCDTEEQCVNAMKRAIAREREKIKATTYMVRETEDDEFIFGHPKSRDLMQNKRFLKEIEL